MSATAEGISWSGDPGDWPGCHLNEQTVFQPLCSYETLCSRDSNVETDSLPFMGSIAFPVFLLPVSNCSPQSRRMVASHLYRPLEESTFPPDVKSTAFVLAASSSTIVVCALHHHLLGPHSVYPLYKLTARLLMALILYTSQKPKEFFGACFFQIDLGFQCVLLVYFLRRIFRKVYRLNSVDVIRCV